MATALAPRLLRLALMLTGSRADAEDLTQATFVRAQRHGERIAAMEAPAAYLRTVMLSVHVSEGRRRRPRTVPLTDDPAVDAAVASVATAGLAEDEPDLWPWLDTLPRQQRAVLVLRYYEDLPDAEIADLVGCSPATVRSHASRGLAALRSAMSKEDLR